MLVYLSGGTLKPRFLQAPAEHRENTPFTSHRWFLTFWEANESSGCSSQKCRHMHVLFGTQFQEIHLFLKPIPGSLDQYSLMKTMSPLVWMPRTNAKTYIPWRKRCPENICCINEWPWIWPGQFPYLYSLTTIYFMYCQVEPAWGLSHSPLSVQVEEVTFCMVAFVGFPECLASQKHLPPTIFLWPHHAWNSTINTIVLWRRGQRLLGSGNSILPSRRSPPVRDGCVELFLQGRGLAKASIVQVIAQPGPCLPHADVQREELQRSSELFQNQNTTGMIWPSRNTKIS